MCCSEQWGEAYLDFTGRLWQTRPALPEARAGDFWVICSTSYSRKRGWNCSVMQGNYLQNERSRGLKYCLISVQLRWNPKWEKVCKNACKGKEVEIYKWRKASNSTSPAVFTYVNQGAWPLLLDGTYCVRGIAITSPKGEHKNWSGSSSA